MGDAENSALSHTKSSQHERVHADVGVFEPVHLHDVANDTDDILCNSHASSRTK